MVIRAGPFDFIGLMLPRKNSIFLFKLESYFLLLISFILKSSNNLK